MNVANFILSGMVFASGEQGLLNIIVGMPLAWLAVVVFSFIIEEMTADMVAIWYVPGALVSMILAILDVNWVIQLVVFVAVSAILLVLAKTVLKKKLQKNHTITPTNIDAIIGKTATVTSRIDNLKECGEVKVNGQYWTARMTDDSVTADEGMYVTVKEVRGVKLICEIKDISDTSEKE